MQTYKHLHTKLTLIRIVVAGSMLVALSSLPLAAHAGSFFGNTAASTENTGATFTGFLSITAVDADTATLTVNLENTTPSNVGGFLTAFVLNNPGNAITSISNFSFVQTTGTGASFDLLGLINNGINAQPFGDFDFGATTGGAFEGGGNPNTGLGVGEAGIFTFTLEGANVDLLTQASFETAFSDNPGGGGAQFFVARFRGLTNPPDGSDKVPGVIPIPAAVWLFGSALVGLIGIARRNGGNAIPA